MPRPVKDRAVHARPRRQQVRHRAQPLDSPMSARTMLRDGASKACIVSESKQISFGVFPCLLPENDR